ncbi:MAG: glycosyltransferase family 4 protein [Acidimicrobiia bacterium]
MTLIHEGGIGGSQKNAVDLAHAMATRGHSITLVVPETVASPLPQRVIGYGQTRPSPGRIAQLRTLVDELRPDLVHAYEWPPILEAYLALGARTDVSLLGTVLSMTVDDEVPRTVPLLVGTRQMQVLTSAMWRAPVGLCLPPVDLAHDAYSAESRTAFRAQYGIGDEECLVVLVSRLSRAMKLSSVQQTISAVAHLDPLVRLVIVGAGDASEYVRADAALVNREHDVPRVQLAGALADPRAAYSAADIVVGMGGSALRAMAHERPVVVVGERGFSAIVDESSVSRFAAHGYFGVGTRALDPARALAERLEALWRAPEVRAACGSLGRMIVAHDHALTHVADTLERSWEIVGQNGNAWERREQRRAVRVAIGREIRLKAHRPRPVRFDGVWDSEITAQEVVE